MARIQPQLNVATSIVDFLKSQGQPSSFQARTQLAGQQGITNYTGAAAQNIALLQAMQRNLNKSAQTSPAGGGSASAAPSASPITTTETPGTYAVKTPDQEHQDKMNALYAKYEGVLSEKPIEKGLSSEEKQTFTDEKTQLKTRYEAALEALKRQQGKEKGRLLGRYAAMGFSEPGAIAGPMASEPGIVTKALQETGEQQKRELTDFEQAQAGNLLAITKAEQDAARRAKAEEADAFEKRQAAMVRNLEKQIELAKPEEFTVGGRVFQRDRVTNQVKDITPSSVGWETKIDDEGNVYRVNPATGKFERSGKVSKKKEKTATKVHEKNLLNVGLPPSIMKANGDLDDAAWNRLMKAGVRLDTAQNIWTLLKQGSNLESIRAYLVQQLGDKELAYQTLDKFIQALQSVGSGEEENPFPKQ